MHNKRKIEQEIEVVLTLKFLAEAYEEISISRMQLVRGKVLSTREYIEKLSEVFSDVKSSYRKELEALMEKGKKIDGGFSFSTLNKNGREVSIFVAANEMFYGGLIKKIFSLFMQNVSSSNSDIIVVGKVGKKLMDESSIKKQYKYVEVSDRNMSNDQLKELIKSTIEYQTVNVFYGQFQNMRNQIPVKNNISGDIKDVNTEKEEKRVSYYFEPSLEKVFAIFNNQIFSSFLKQAMSEAELARLASRVWAMEDALGNIAVTHKRLKQDKIRALKLSENSKQIQRVSGFLIWGQLGK